MQTFNASALPAGGVLSGTFAWLAQTRSSPAAQALQTAAAAAGIRSPNEADSDEDGEPALLEMDVSPDIRGLLTLGAGHARTRQARDAISPPRRSFGSSDAAGSMRNADDLLARRLAEARDRIGLSTTKAELARQGVSQEQVKVQLRVNADNLRESLATRAAEGMVVFPLVPSAASLFDAAVVDAVREAAWTASRHVAVETTPQATPGVQGVAAAHVPTAETAPTVATAPRDQPVDLAKRAVALQHLADFEPRFDRRLIIHVQTRGPDFSDVANGVLNFASLQDLLSLAPCASSVEWAGGYWAVYPQNHADDGNVNNVRLHDRVVLVARDENPHRVMYRDRRAVWIATDVYTDDVVEAAKIEMWSRIRGQARVRRKQSDQMRRWLNWR